VTQAPDPNIDWSLCTPQGQDLDQLRRWSALPLMARLRALEEMCDHARATIAFRQRQGLPYFDPYTGELIEGTGTGTASHPTCPTVSAENVNISRADDDSARF
jgi:hypothetical protein